MRDHPLFAAAYERVSAPAEAGWLGRLRHGLLSRSSGRVLEIGGGVGANFAHYPDAVTSVVVCEPDGAMRRRLERRLAHAPPSMTVDVVPGGVPGLDLAGGSFDTIVCTLVLCTVPDVPGALAELHGLLHPEGRLLFLEHVISPGLVGWAERAIAPAWQHLAAGCRCDRDTIAALRAADFVVADCERPTVFGRGSARFLVVGSAVPRVWASA
ncbi:MAG TPA: class I SAM-dependent methyltransferase [Acidimicrobiales bacterium]|nr:class I SAM-dependent methyltransferase [Acidimicrobiales bacterium]